MTRAEEYRIEFNKLETMLKKRANARSEESISSVVSSLVNIHKDRVVRQFERDIRQFIELRNAIIHQSTDRAIAEPYEETVTALRQLVVNIVLFEYNSLKYIKNNLRVTFLSSIFVLKLSFNT